MDNISDLLGGVLSNPEMMDKVKTLMPIVSQMLKSDDAPLRVPSAPQQAPSSQVPPLVAQAPPANEQANILADANVAAAVQNLIAALSSAKQPEPDTQLNQEASPAFASVTEPEAVSLESLNIEKTLDTLKSVSTVASPENDHRAKLLLSLKPFLGESRRTKIDAAIKYINAAKIFSMFGKNGFV